MVLKAMKYRVKFGQEDDGRWIADLPELPGVMAYGITRENAFYKVVSLALRVLADEVALVNSTEGTMPGKQGTNSYELSFV